ncbi:MAG: bifunctional aspartate kinase/homoserine dehydrogenase I [Saprospiraceae bacterium]|nr:bifunctional aspartate kinase/homoserine dehydrogenase I [Saprospiraceae bacterium]
MKVLKFGGSSVAKPERIEGVVRILRQYYQRGDKFAVVFSAFGGVTDSLIEMGNLAADGNERYQDLFQQFSQRHIDAATSLLKGEYLDRVLPELQTNHEVLGNLLYGVFLVREVSPRTLDYILSFGERNAAFIISHVMRQAGIHAAFLDARKIIKTDKSFGNAKVDFEQTNDLIKEYFNQNPEIQVVTGFIGAAKGGLTTTLGRGGSDYTAAILGAGLDASAIEIWTDVDGVMTADPRKVKKAFSLPQMTYAEAMEMSHFGAKVIYPPTIQPALAKKIPLYIKNTFNPDFEGTFISDKADAGSHAVKGISSISHIALITLQGGGMVGVPGIAGRLFTSLAHAGVNVIIITQGSSEHSISFAVQPTSAAKAKRSVEREFEFEMRQRLIESVKVEEDLAAIAIIGENMRYRPGISGRLFQALGKNGVNVVAIAQGSSELNISVVINRADETKALNAIHEAFFLSDTQELHLFMIGVGLIGATLIKQIKAQALFLKEKRAMEIKIVGLANSKKMYFEENGVDLDNWKEFLQASDAATDVAGFVQRMKQLNLSNTIFVDNTANAKVADYYEDILNASISISTPNKIGTSSSYLQYQRLKTISERKGVLFMYETNVGAGLPVISTLNDLINSGDRIIRIEGILSGSLSFIFNSFTEGRQFSDIVKEAMSLGYTEPDPRIDLNGVDVRRKLLILARETGLALEAADVVIEPILPEACQQAANVDELLDEITQADSFFESKRAAAAKAGKVLRMVAKLENAQASISLQAVDQSHPFAALNGSDNMIVFTTERYKDRPLVVRGPGAGAEVTAAGVFAEIIKIGNFLS